MHLAQSHNIDSINNEMTNLNHLTLNSTLADLPNLTYHIEDHIYASVLLEILEKNPDIPGVIITNNSQIVGMFSRQKIERKKVLPSWQKSYHDYPLRKLLHTVENPPLILADNFLINSAAKLALDRSAEEIFEPIIVLFATGNFGLIKMADLLLAQNYLLQLAMAQIAKLKYGKFVVYNQISTTDETASSLPPKSQYLIHKIKGKLHDHQQYQAPEKSNTK